MAHTNTGIVGADLDGDLNEQEGKTFALGTNVLGSDGERYIYIEAGEALGTPGTQVDVASADFTATADNEGAFYTVAALASGGKGWVKTKTLDLDTS